MKSDVVVVTSLGTDYFKQAEWCVEEGILVVQKGRENLCYPLSNVVRYTFRPEEGEV